MEMNRRCGYFSFVILFICMVLIYAGIREIWGDGQKRNKVMPISVAGIALEVELATTPEDQILGLMYRDHLGDNEGMLFIFPTEKELSFWMKDTHIPLSLAFIKEDGRIVQIESMKPYSLDTHVSREKVKYALEMKEGWFTMHKVKEGDRIKIPRITDDKNINVNER
ncbi:MAG: DUF192 domain-containing protein [Candidatus Brocadiaceae bacterium]|nr:DUF192 domain-containing protein [Candidatus Brocadiaceae bacterium]